ncbi:MAG: Phosphofructokinase [Hydrocarboniphaga sp.]|uniref:1-phosphofructokinase n=1 Tax=Hydrocarboniphaga sp. TaxID=2033016 RepID=UPI00260D26DF|nr:1-phosphofructokinase [Hydrocarboniphaga sp.]MDB5969161.1 Phosphofructokinase [Hydrocarboniphaga sp.]
MSARVVTVTLNPAIDQTVILDALQLGAVNRARSARVDAGGKGVNVASCLADWGVATAVTGLLGRANASVFEALFDAKRIDDRCLRLSGETRTNIKLVGKDGTTTDINLPGLNANAGDLIAVGRALGDLCAPGVLAVLSGSLPSGLPEDSYVELLKIVAANEARAVLDTSGAPLSTALAAPKSAMPYAVKPNRQELEAWAERRLADTADLLAAAQELRALGIALVVVSLGTEGALFVSDAGALLARAPVIETSSTVGAGDAMVAGLSAALLDNADLETTARLATAFAAAKLGLPGPNLPDRRRVNELAAATKIRGIP